MSDEECIHHKSKQNKKIRQYIIAILIITFTILLIFLITWAILQPKKPHFLLQDATLFNFNISSPNLVSSNFQITLTSHNPNERIGLYYDNLNAYAVYQNQQITFFTAVPPVYQGHKGTNVWSPFLYGVDVPIAPYNGVTLRQDQTEGVTKLLIKIDGRVRWKVGAFTTGRYHIRIRCQAIINFGNRVSDGVFVSSGAVKYQLYKSCGVSV
ncbi:NDR1/HIN1-like protein 1 [Impatiens glandulifera]|uniref:NDR1/HIN1-like protein 1 n=1 Tax=Impatiens glandulifera TaxID=253017 RepID=UPI001FB0E1BD|nr:NDR1/HIN1-like protein 1 [Impatiens glandulifera]